MSAIMSSTARFLKTAFFVILVLAIGAGAFFTLGSYSDGVRVGQIVKLSKRGFIFKTWEGELYQGFLESDPSSGGTGGIATRSWNFTVSDESNLIKNMNGIIEHGGKAKVHYHEKFALLPWVGETKYVVDSVEAVQ